MSTTTRPATSRPSFTRAVITVVLALIATLVGPVLTAHATTLPLPPAGYRIAQDQYVTSQPLSLPAPHLGIAVPTSTVISCKPGFVIRDLDTATVSGLTNLLGGLSTARQLSGNDAANWITLSNTPPAGLLPLVTAHRTASSPSASATTGLTSITFEFDNLIADTVTLTVNWQCDWNSNIATTPVSGPSILGSNPKYRALIGQPIHWTFVFQGSPVPYIGLQGQLPPGLTMSNALYENASIVTVVGTPTTAGTWNAQLLDTVSGAGSSFAVNVYDPPSLGDVQLPPAVVGQPYNYPVPTFGGDADVSLDSLPPGLTLTSGPAGSAVTGTPTTAGNYAVDATIAPARDIYIDDADGYYHALDFSDQRQLPLLVTVAAPSIQSPSASTLPLAASGQPYQFTVPVTGSPASFAVTDGALPANVTLDPATGVISGTPDVSPAPSGTFDFQVTASNAAGQSAVHYTLNVVTTNAITSGAPPNAEVGTPYHFTFTAVDGPGTINEYLPQGCGCSTKLPPGLTLTQDGQLTGTPTVPGKYQFSIKADYSTLTPAQQFGITVDAVPSLGDLPQTNGQVGTVFSAVVPVTGFPAPRIDWTGTLPPGIRFDLAAHRFLGGPTAGGVYQVTVTATNELGTAVSRTYTLTIAARPKIAAVNPGPLLVDAPYRSQLALTGYPAPTVSLDPGSGPLPDGLSVSSDGVVSGAPSQDGTWTVTFDATNATATATRQVTFTVQRRAQITSDVPPAATLGQPYSFAVTATGAPVPTVAVSDGSLPDGLTLDPNTGVLSGTPTVAGLFHVQISADNGLVPTDVRIYDLAVQGPPSIAGDQFGDLRLGQSVQLQVRATGFPLPTFTVTAGSLPAGLTLDQTHGLVSGTLAHAGAYAFTVTAANGLAPDANQTYSGSVVTPAGLPGGATPPPGTVGTKYRFKIPVRGYPIPAVTVVNGRLPAGLSISPTGLVTGTPTVAGTSSVVLTATNTVDGTVCTTRRRYVFTVH